MTEAIEQEVTLLDTCCLLNLYATGYIADILRTVPMELAIAERVSSEAIYVGGSGSGEGEEDREEVDLSNLLRDGLLTVLVFASEEEEATFVAFAAELDDGEAMTCALAVHRGCTVATDDRKTVRVLRSHPNGRPVHSTAELVKAWSEAEVIPRDTLRDVLKAIAERARFIPRRDDPLRSWWDSVIRSAE